ncbi:MAG: DotU family type IV/VI secretion system protein [Thermoanaerobaculia bacterium]
MSPGDAPPLLTDLFRGIFSLLEQSRRRIERGVSASGGATGGSDGSVEGLQAPFMELLERRDAEGDRSADALNLEEARYALAVFADDAMLCFEWPDSNNWRGATLESRLFQTDKGTLEVLRRIEKLLEVGDPGRRELGRLYLFILSLGLGGDPEDGSAQRRLSNYRRQLLAFALPDRSGGESDPWISPSAYEHTAGRSAGDRLPNLKAWAWAALGALVVLFASSYFLWQDATAAIDWILEKSGVV